MPIPRSFACAAVAAATVAAVVVPAQAGLAATPSFPAGVLRSVVVVRPQAPAQPASPPRSAPAPTPTADGGPSSVSAAPPAPGSTSAGGAPAAQVDPADDAPRAAPTSDGASVDDTSGVAADPDGSDTDAPDGDESGATPAQDAPRSAPSPDAPPSGDVQVVDGVDVEDADPGVLAGEVQVVDGIDAEEDPAADAAGSFDRPVARGGRPSGRWAAIARPRAVRAATTASAGARVTWRAGTGGLAVRRFVVELRGGTSVLRTSAAAGARSFTFWNLVPARRYTVKVTAVAVDGSRRSAVGVPLRTPAAPKAPVHGARAAVQR